MTPAHSRIEVRPTLGIYGKLGHEDCEPYIWSGRRRPRRLRVGAEPPSRSVTAFRSCNQVLSSLAEAAKSFTGGPVPGAFNLNFAVLFDQIAAQQVLRAMTAPATSPPTTKPPPQHLDAAAA